MPRTSTREITQRVNDQSTRDSVRWLMRELQWVRDQSRRIEPATLETKLAGEELRGND